MCVFSSYRVHISTLSDHNLGEGNASIFSQIAQHNFCLDNLAIHHYLCNLAVKTHLNQLRKLTDLFQLQTAIRFKYANNGSNFRSEKEREKNAYYPKRNHDRFFFTMEMKSRRLT